MRQGRKHEGGGVDEEGRERGGNMREGKWIKRGGKVMGRGSGKWVKRRGRAHLNKPPEPAKLYCLTV